MKYDGQATPQEIHAYQCRVGSTIYPSIITRPDIAHSASILSNFLQNPSPIHREQLDNVIGHLRDTKTYGLNVIQPVHPVVVMYPQGIGIQARVAIVYRTDL